MTSSAVFLHMIDMGEPSEDPRLLPAFAADRTLVLEPGEQVALKSNVIGAFEEHAVPGSGNKRTDVWSRQRDVFDFVATNHRFVFWLRDPTKQRSIMTDTAIWGVGGGSVLHLAKKARNKAKYHGVVVGGQIRYEHVQAVSFALGRVKLEHLIGIVVCLKAGSPDIEILSLIRSQQGHEMAKNIAQLAARRQLQLHDGRKAEPGLAGRWQALQKQAATPSEVDTFLGKTIRLDGYMHLDSTEPAAILAARRQAATEPS
jgi:hypothetical protein